MPPARGCRRLLSSLAALASGRELVAGGTGLHTLEVDLLLGNAVWNPAAQRLREVVGWCGARQIPAAVIRCADGHTGPPPARDALRAAGFARTAAWRWRRADERGDPHGAPAAAQATATPWEQIGWTGTRAAADRFAADEGRPDQAVGLATALTRGLRRAPTLMLGTAFDGAGGAVGAALLDLPTTASGSTLLWWTAGPLDGAVAWAAGLAPDAGAPWLLCADASGSAAAVERWTRAERGHEPAPPGPQRVHSDR